MKIHALSLFALTALLSSVAWGDESDGNIRSIDAMPDLVRSISYPNASSPLTTVGQQVYIRVRLLNFDWDQTKRGDNGGVANPWYFAPSATGISMGESILALNTPALGISVGGVSRQAFYTSKGPESQESGANALMKWYTDLYFVYTVQAGDIGLPIKLLNSTGKIASEAAVNTDYLLYNVNTAGASKSALWDLKTAATNSAGKNPLAQFHFGPENPSASDGTTPDYPQDGPWTTAHRSYDFASEGVYIRTLDFDTDYADAEVTPKIWREVQLGTDEPYTIDATIVGAVTGGVVYVWSADETVVVPTARGDAVIIDDGTGKKVAQVTIREGTGTFGLKGVGAIGATTTIYMGATTSSGYTKVGDAIEASTSSRTVKVRKAPDPYINVATFSGNANKFALQATTNYEASTAMRVSVSDRGDITDSITVKLNPQFYRGNTAVDLDEADPVAGSYIRILTEENDPTLVTGVTEVTIPAGEREAVFYLYALGAPSDKTINRLVLKPTIDNEEQWAHYSGGNNKSATITLTDQAPVIVVPSETAVFSGFDGDTIPNFNVAILDNWRDLQTDLNTAGYTVEVSFPNGGTKFSKPGIHFTEDVEQTFAVTAPAEGTYPAVITVKDPAGNTVSREVTIRAAHALEARIKAYRDEAFEQPYADGYVFQEGDNPYVRVELSSAATAPMYAFLRPVTDDDRASVICEYMDTGLFVAQGDTASAATRITFKDGYTETKPMRTTFKVGLKSTEAWDSESAIDYTTTYAPRTTQFTVVNVSPTVAGVTMNATSVENGGTFSTRAPAGSPVTFSARLSDLSPVDLDATGEDAIWVRWVWTDGLEGMRSDYTAFSSAANRKAQKQITFQEEGQTQTVSVYVLDKDDRKAQVEKGLPSTAAQEDYDWGEAAYTFKVNVSESARVNILDDSGAILESMTFAEDALRAKAYFYIQLSTAPANAGTYKDPDTSVSDKAISSANPIKVQLKKEVWGSDGNVEFESETIELSDGNRKKVYLNPTTLNGGSDTYYNITAEVITDDCRNSYGQYWKDYYQSSSSELFVTNVAPTLTSVKRTNGSITETGTNRWSAGETIQLSWQVRDVIPDITNGRFQMEWSIDSSNPTQYPNPYVFPETITYSTVNSKFGVVKGTYEFTVPDVENQVLRLTVDDGDGGQVVKEWAIYVAQTKKLSVSPIGPVSPSETKYRMASGLGRGSVFVDDSVGANTTIIRDFIQTWSFSESVAQARVTAEGYEAVDGDAFDTGNRATGYVGVPISPSGGRGSTGNYYNYGNSTLDNYFYCWAIIGGDEGTTLLDPVPSRRSKTHYFDLAAKEDGDTASYKTTQVEAIFSKEQLASDNMGDINQDYVPDIYALKYTGLGVFDVTGKTVGDDLASLSASNVDEDYLPNTMSATAAAFIPNLSNTWVTAGRAFTTKLEIRGYGECFNDAPTQAGIQNVSCDINYANPEEDDTSTLTKLEYRAFVEWCGRQDPALEPTTKENWSKWSPERPTDPTVADTDGDGMPDGYEYYFWYRAHVGYFDADGNYCRQTGRKYNPKDPVNYIEISADDIEKAYDPLNPNYNLATIDSDNDGLPDLVEFEIGTNPFDYDTDGDGLPDGYEVTRCVDEDGNIVLSPLKASSNGGLSDANRNDDGDQMATITKAMVAVEITFEDTAQNETYYAFADEIQDDDGNVLVPSELTSESDLHFFTTWEYRKGEYALGKLVYSTANEEQLQHLQSAQSFAVGAQSNVTLYHFQVYANEGFDPRTGWNPVDTPTDVPHRVDTAAFTAYDEFMLLAFFYQTGGLTDAEVTPSASRTLETIWAATTTSPLNADTDKDGMPDGWELYVMAGPENYSAAPGSAYSPLSSYAAIKGTSAENPDINDRGEPESDHLGFDREWCGVECCAAYESCETIVNLQPEWKNKIWPTDPWATDTDGDGLSDGDEYSCTLWDKSVVSWIYGSAEHTHPYYEDCVDGGGLNPLSWDTDGDGLPDPWELEFHATIADAGTVEIVSTNGTSSVTNTASTGAGALRDGMNPTKADAFEDYDNDGLLNWQEYMVGAMRCWRYDDVTTPWISHQMTPADVEAHKNDGDWWGHVLVERWLDTDADGKLVKYNGLAKGDNSYEYNPGFANGFFDLGSYFSYCDVPWELSPRVRGALYLFKDGVDHDLRDELKDDGLNGKRNRWTTALWQEILTWGSDAPEFSVPSTPYHYPSRYITCDPRKADTDGDGMDDYYELFHGLNPLLGKAGSASETGPCDVVYRAWYVTDPDRRQNPPSALANYWVNGDTPHNGTFRKEVDDVRIKNPDAEADNHSVYDFYQFPWLAGLPDVDPDGDNIRNLQEAILPNVQAASTYQHTDPTPLWMTDTSYTNSLTHRFYQLRRPAWALAASGTTLANTEFANGSFTYKGVKYDFNDFPWMHYDKDTQVLSFGSRTVNFWGSGPAAFTYEENEGYDSDHDFLSDYEESQAKTKASSDPLQHDDPIRHQAMWFNGTDAFLQTPLADEYRHPVYEASSELRQNFLYFTVEAWAKPDADIVNASGLYTILERPVWSGPSNPADESFLRKNFLIGLKNGRWYAKFDSTGTDLNQAVEITNGPEATTNWTHVAATYGPADDDERSAASKMCLRLYVNGILQKTVSTAMQPEHGLSAVTIDEVGALNGYETWDETVSSKPVISILVGASAATWHGIVPEYAWEMRTQSNEEGAAYPYVDDDDQTTIDDYDSFFKGYIDEVRIWDGARTAADIKKDVDGKVRYTSALAQANREAVFNAWKLGARRSIASTGEDALPPELMHHWSFDHLPGATRTADVLQTPAGFTTPATVADAKAVWSRPEGWTSDRWNALGLRSTVYKNAAYVPWINDTVSHLPCFDGTTLDSVYWSEDYAGTTPAISVGLSSFTFPRTAEVWSSIVQQTYPNGSLTNDVDDAENYVFSSPTRWNLVAGDDVAKLKFRFNLRNRTTVGHDLLPLGGAYPKRISSTEGGMWDDGAPADAWAQSGSDADNNGIDDAWELYARENYTDLEPWDTFTRDTTVNYHGVSMPAWQAYLRDLAHGWLPSDKTCHPEYEDVRDADGDGMPDWWEQIYGIDTGSATDGDQDADGDGLSNYAEYFVSEVLKGADGSPLMYCDPLQYATDGKVCDYFKKVGDLYLGELLTDHDHMNDQWEAQYPVAFVNRYVYDPLGDADKDGWSNYAEFRAGTDPSNVSAISIDGYSVPEYPVPTIAANVIYTGSATIESPIVFKVWNEDTDFAMEKAPDATWTLGTATSSESSSSGSSTASSSSASALTQCEKFLGRKPATEKTFYLSGGNVSEGSVKLALIDKGYSLATYDETTGKATIVGLGEPDDALWFYNVYDRGGDLLKVGASLYADEDSVKVGTIDYKTGRITIDFSNSLLCGAKLADPASAENGTSSSSSGSTNTYHYVNLDNAYARIVWSASLGDVTGAGMHYLSDPDPATDKSKHLREGKNTFVCFVDADGDGEYTAGELFGVVRGVDVGWAGASFDVELTETHPIFGRFDLTGGSDRAYWYGDDSDNIQIIEGTQSASTNAVTDLPSGGYKQRVRITRYMVNGVKIGVGTNEVFVDTLVLMDKWLTSPSRAYIHEGDFLGKGSFDIDWDTLQDLDGSDALKTKFPNGEINSMAYRIVVDNHIAVNPVVSNRVLDVAFTRLYDSKALRKVPSGLGAVVSYGARPTFRWTMNGFNTYTAFKLRITDASGAVVYESDTKRAPAVDEKGYYVWKADFSVGDQTPQGKILANVGNYSWSVSMYNAKFRTDSWSESAPLTTYTGQQKDMNGHGYGTLSACVKYAGPELVLASCDDVSSVKGKVRVQAFSTADFSGVPAASAVLADKASLVDLSNGAANVVLAGLEPGEYFVRAYIDSDGDFEKDDWESWGYAEAAVTVTEGENKAVAAVWIEDADTDGDNLPDAWEYAKYGNLTTAQAKAEEGYFVLNQATYAGLIDGATSASGLAGSTLSFLKSADAAALVSGLGSDTSTSSIATIRTALQRKLESACISSLVIDNSDAANPKVVMTVSGEVSDSGIKLSNIYTVSESLYATDVTIKVYRKDSLVALDWTHVKDIPVTVSVSFDETVEVPLDEDLSSGFYKIEVVQ